MLLTHAVRGRRERKAFGHQFSTSRAAQKNRAVYAIAMQLLYAINPSCDHPIQAMMNRNLYYSGGSCIVRELCSRLGWTIARSTGRERRLFEPLEQDILRRRWLLAGLEAGCYLQFIDDNLDWVGAILRIAHAWTAKHERGVHVLTREVYLLGDYLAGGHPLEVGRMETGPHSPLHSRSCPLEPAAAEDARHLRDQILCVSRVHQQPRIRG